MRRLHQFRSVVLLLLGSLACAGQRTASDGATPRASGQVVLMVENHHWNDVIVYLLHDGVADRLGMATAVKS